MGLVTTPRRKARNKRRQQAEERRWAAKNGPVIVRRAVSQPAPEGAEMKA